MIGKPEDWKTVLARLSIERFATDSWQNIKSKIVDSAEEIFNEWLAHNPLSASDFKHKYTIAKGVAKYAITKELAAEQLDANTLSDYQKAMDSLALNISPVFSELVENGIRQEMAKETKEKAEANIPKPTPSQDLSKLPPDIRQLMEKAKITELLKLEAGKTHRHNVEEEGEWIAKTLAEEGADPAEQVQKIQEEEAAEHLLGKEKGEVGLDVVPTELAPKTIEPDVAESLPEEAPKTMDADTRVHTMVELLNQDIAPEELKKRLREIYSKKWTSLDRKAADKPIPNPVIPQGAEENLAPQEPIILQDKKDRMAIVREIFGYVDSILPRWKRENEAELENYMLEAYNRAKTFATKYLSGGIPLEEKPKFKALENPDENQINAWTEKILNTNVETHSGAVKSPSELINDLVGWNSLTSEEGQHLKGQLAQYVKDDLEQIWIKIYSDVMKAANAPYKGQE